jgi:hypothetical protein
MTDAVPPQTSHRRRIMVLIGAALIIGGALTYWQVSARQAIGDVSIVPESLVCNGKPIPYTIDTGEGEDAPRPAFAFSLGAGDECMLTIAVINDGSRDVHVDSMTFPMLKPGDASGVVAEVVDPSGGGLGARSGDSDSYDAVFDVDESVSAGEWTSESYIVRYRVPSSTCTAITSGSPDLPTARVSTAGVATDVKGGVTLLIKASPPAAGVPNDCD